MVAHALMMTDRTNERKGKTMAIKTNSKQARENLTRYILDWSVDDIEESNEWAAKEGGRVYDPESPADVADYILAEFRRGTAEWERIQYGQRAAFFEWTGGLPMGGLFCFRYNRSAKADVAEILEETETERDRFSEEEAEHFLADAILEWCLRNRR